MLQGLAAGSLLLSRPLRAQVKSHVFAVVPQFPSIELHRAWEPILRELEAATGADFELLIFRSIPEFERAFLAGQPDFIYCNPIHMVMAQPVGYRPLVRSSEMLSGILVVRSDSTITAPDQLAGKTIAFPAPNAFGASLYLHICEPS